MIEIEIWSDFVCPFCCIGLKNLKAAISQLPPEEQKKCRIQLKSFELDPQAPKSQKISIFEVLAKKYGRSIEWAKQTNVNVTAMAAEVGVVFNMERVVPTNSFDAHRMGFLAKQKFLSLEWHERLFLAYFTEGQDLADRVTLTKLGIELGLDAKDISSTLDSNTFEDEVRADESEAHEIGVEGVPFFVFDRKIAVSGAQPKETFLKVFSELSKA